jgi:exodeoxyribonuclease VII large subunit
MGRLPFDPSRIPVRRKAPTRAESPAASAEAPNALDGSPPIRTVSQVTAMIAGVLADVLPETLWIQGEISNFRTYDRGHAFFTLKDASSELPCVLWKDQLARLAFKPTDGMAVLARGAIKLYEPQGKVQFYVDALSPQGAGALELAFRQRYAALKAEGLFEPERKRKIPLLPERVVIITSRTGDVLHDVLTTAYRRFPGVHTLLYPVRVQGDAAAGEMVAAIRTLNRHAAKLCDGCGIDLILLVRGGGSLEDLWAFNDETLARTIAGSKIPIATGIGHEPDTTIADLVADLRGPTPTGITELTIPDVRTLRQELISQSIMLRRDLLRQLGEARGTVRHAGAEMLAAARTRHRMESRGIDRLQQQIARIEPRHAIAQGWRRVDDAARRLERALTATVHRAARALQIPAGRLGTVDPKQNLRRAREYVNRLNVVMQYALRQRLAGERRTIESRDAHLRAIGPAAVLARGYSITTDAAGNIVRSATQVKNGDIIKTQLSDGAITSTVGTPRQGKLF